MSQPTKSFPVRILVPVVIVAVFIVGFLLVNKSGPDVLVVYCAHDSVYSDEVLKRFEEETGIRVAAKYDTEATKSLGLVELLIREKDAPRCDVFWNNQLLGTLDLQRRGILHPYKGSGWQRIPERFRDPDGHWVGFGARMRVFIVNTEKHEATEEAVARTLAGEDLSSVAIAKPLFGTTLTHYSVLWDLWGGEKLKAWHADVRKRGMREVLGNSTVKNLVAGGQLAFGYTDTDDHFVAVDEGKPVAMVPVRLENGATIAMPNTVAIVKGTKRLEKAKKLVDFLASRESELAMARSKSRQIPLGPVEKDELPDDVKALAKHAADGQPLGNLLEARTACLAWLKTLYVGGEE
jgi:iron(III) transport system substrate-binding protein